MKFFPSSIALSCLAACASTRAPVVPTLAGASEVAVHYSSRLSGAGGLSSIDVEPRECRDGTGEARTATAPESEKGALVQVHCKFVEMDRGDALSMLGARLCARRTTRASVEQAIGDLERGGDAEFVTAPRVVLFDGSRGDIRVVNRRAFVEAFEVTEGPDPGGAFVGDPVVANVAEGIAFEATPSVIEGGSAVRLELHLRSCDLLDAMHETSTKLPGTGTSVTIEHPVCFVQHTSTSADLGPEEALVIGGLPTKREDRVLVAFVTTRICPPETASR